MATINVYSITSTDQTVVVLSEANKMSSFKVYPSDPSLTGDIAAGLSAWNLTVTLTNGETSTDHNYCLSGINRFAMLKGWNSEVFTR